MGFHRTVLRLKRAARFFFYCQQIIKIFLIIRIMTHQHPCKKDIVAANLTVFIIIYRQCKTHLIPIPAILRIFLMLLFRVLRILLICSNLNQFGNSLCCVCLCFCNRTFQGNPTFGTCIFIWKTTGNKYFLRSFLNLIKFPNIFFEVRFYLLPIFPFHTFESNVID